MALISLVGCNAIGKTTAARRWAVRYAGLCVANADIQTELVGGVVRRERAWKGTNEDKERLTQRCRAADTVWLAESARTTHLNYIGPADPVLIVTCTRELYEKHMRARCAAKGKRFRDDYWDDKKLGYECADRYLRWAIKHLRPEQMRHFVITDQAADWPAVDDYFGQVYRRLHNALVRARAAGGVTV